MDSYIRKGSNMSVGSPQHTNFAAVGMGAGMCESLLNYSVIDRSGVPSAEVKFSTP